MKMLWLLLGCWGCASTFPVAEHGSQWSLAESAIKQGPIVMASPVFVADVPDPKRQESEPQPLQFEDVTPDLLPPTIIEDGPFLRNEWVGNVRFSGGLIRVGEASQQARARWIALNEQESYQGLVKKWWEDTYPHWLPQAASLSLAHIPAIERVRIRGTNERDGRDNLNIPRTKLVPLAFSSPELAEVKTQLANEMRSELPDRWLLIPFVRNYYTHNGGWFLGQHWGTMGGARFELLLVIYDLESGQPVWWLSTEAVAFSRAGAPNLAELDGYLLEVEHTTEQQIQHQWLR